MSCIRVIAQTSLDTEGSDAAIEELNCRLAASLPEEIVALYVVPQPLEIVFADDDEPEVVASKLTALLPLATVNYSLQQYPQSLRVRSMVPGSFLLPDSDKVLGTTCIVFQTSGDSLLKALEEHSMVRELFLAEALDISPAQLWTRQTGMTNAFCFSTTVEQSGVIAQLTLYLEPGMHIPQEVAQQVPSMYQQDELEFEWAEG
jgi:hypothetical protein